MRQYEFYRDQLLTFTETDESPMGDLGEVVDVRSRAKRTTSGAYRLHPQARHYG